MDLFIDEPIAVNDLLARSQAKDLEGIPVRIACIADLIEMKRRAGRPRDRGDLDKLQQILDAGSAESP